ncbi:MAG: hypothetical protein WC967_12045 [Balneolaceae bacterium]
MAKIQTVAIILVLTILSGCGSLVVDREAKIDMLLYQQRLESVGDNYNNGFDTLKNGQIVIKKTLDKMDSGLAKWLVDYRVKVGLRTHYEDARIAIFDMEVAGIKDKKYSLVVIKRGIPIINNINIYLGAEKP